MKRFWKLFSCCLLLLGIVLAIPGNAKADNDGAGNYYIKVNLGTNVTTVYKKDGTPYKAMISSAGFGTEPGTYYTPVKYRWKELLGPSYGQYSTRIYGGVLFHSVYYWTNGDKSSMHTEAYNLLGTTQSHGCIRLLVKDCKWIYDNCPLGTKVIIFRGSAKDDPLGKPALMRINNGKYTNWDPTDPDPANPWRSAKPSITLTGSNIVPLKSKFQARAAITATDSLGNDVTDQVRVIKGKVKTSTPGTYSIVYRLKDGLGRVATKRVKYIVKDTSGPKFTGLKNQSTAVNQQIPLLKGVSAKTLTGKNLTNKIKVYYKNSAGKFKACKNGKLTLKEAGNYTIRYSVQGPNKSVTTSYTTLKVIDKRVKLGGSDTVNIEYGTKFKLSSYVTVKNQKDKAISKKSHLTYSGKVNTRKVGSYTVTYTGMYKGKPYTKATKKITFHVINEQAPILTVGSSLPSSIAANSAPVNLLEGVSAKSATGVKLTSSIKVFVNGTEISNPKAYTFATPGNYNIVYQVQVPTGKKTASVVKSIQVTEPATQPVTEQPTTTQPVTEQPTTTLPAAQ